MSIPTTREQYKDWCLRQLGAPVLDINIDDDQVDDCVDMALQYYQDFHFDGVGAVTASGVAGEIRASDNITAYASSDKRLKENIRDIHDAVSIVSTIGGKYFDWKDEYIDKHGGEDGYFLRKSDFGVIAQDVQGVFPVAVRERSDSTLAVDYEKLVALAFAAIKELKAEIDELKKGR